MSGNRGDLVQKLKDHLREKEAAVEVRRGLKVCSHTIRAQTATFNLLSAVQTLSGNTPVIFPIYSYIGLGPYGILLSRIPFSFLLRVSCSPDICSFVLFA